MTLEEYLNILDGYTTVSLYDQDGRLINEECTIKSILKWMSTPVENIVIRIYDYIDQKTQKTQRCINLGVTLFVDIQE